MTAGHKVRFISAADLILNRTVGTVEGGKDAIAGCIHQATSDEPELLTQDLFVPIEQRPPRCITELRGTFPAYLVIPAKL